MALQSNRFLGMGSDYKCVDAKSKLWRRNKNFCSWIFHRHKGYIGTGYDGTAYYNDFWEYDQSNNTWTAKANFPGAARYYAVGLSIGTKGYIGTGIDAGGTKYNDFYEYDPTNNTWSSESKLLAEEQDMDVRDFLSAVKDM